MANRIRRRAQVLAVVNRKGGVGKTTTAINLAHGLSRRLLRRVPVEDLEKVSNSARLYTFKERYYYIEGHVLLVDFDSQGQCAEALGVEPGEADVGEVLLNRQHLSKAVVSGDRATDGLPRPNLWILPASDRLERGKEALQGQSMAYYLDGSENKEEWLLAFLDRQLGMLRRHFTFMIFDCAPGFDSFTLALQRFAGEAVIPVKPDYLSMAGTNQNMRQVDDLRLRGINIDIHTIVPTFFVAQQRLDRDMIAELRKIHGERVSEPIPRSQLVAEAPGKKCSIFEIDPRIENPATVAYQKLVDKVYYD